MSKNWVYANLSKIAKQNGGPEQFLLKVAEENLIAGKNKGRKEMIPVVLIATGLGSFFGWAYAKIDSKIQEALKESDKYSKDFITIMEANDEKIDDNNGSSEQNNCNEDENNENSKENL